MLRAVWAAKWYLLLGTLAFVLFLVATTPLHFVWRYAEPMARQLPFQIQQPTGTLWSGEAQINAPRIGTVAAHWTLSPWALLQGNVSLNLNADGEALRLTGQADLGGLYQGMPDQVQLTNVNGYLDAAALAPLMAQMSAQLDGDFTLSDINADVSINDRRIDDASGRLVYSGGQVNARVQRQSIATELPMLIAELRMDGDVVRVPVITDAGEPLGTLYMQPDGWGGVSVLRRAVDIAGQSWPDKDADADTVIFEVSQKFL